MSYHCMLRVTLSVVFKVFAEAEPLGLQSPEPAAIPSTLVPLSSLPLRTRGRDIVAATSGQRVRLFCVSWYGAHMEEMVVNGLNSQPAEAIANLIVRFGFNCVRLSFSVEMVLSNRTRVPDPDKSLWANPALKDLSPLALYDVVLSALTEAGLLVIMDNHISSAMWCCNTVDGEGLWHTKEYPESAWVEALAVMASRHSKNPRVVAFELRNEIRASPLGKPLWGEGGQELDWSAAAERGARVVVDKKPDLLVVVSGLEFSSNLCDVHRRPIHDVPFLRNRLIYTVHHYPWISVAYFGSVYLTYRIRTVALVCTIISVSFFVVFLLLLVRRLLLRRVVVEAATDPSSEVPSQKSKHEVLQCLYVAANISRVVSASILTVIFLCGFVPQKSLVQCSASSGRVGHIAYVSRFLGICAGFAAFLAWLFCLPDVFCFRRNSVGKLSCVHCCSRAPAASSFSKPCPKAFLRLRKFVAVVSPWVGLLAIFCCIVEARTYRAFEREMDLRLANVLEGGSGFKPAPVWLGEFGTDTDDIWWQHMIRYIEERAMDFSYWPLNGQKRPYVDETYGILQQNFMDVRHPWKLADLQRLMAH